MHRQATASSFRIFSAKVQGNIAENIDSARTRPTSAQYRRAFARANADHILFRRFTPFGEALDVAEIGEARPGNASFLE